ncbi:Tissue alpha-L-fucosidase [Halocaridina rubra]|uniref:Putative alpha-L-fucosidase n=1 Tax=Halocaridina rubra TaxID=373956 RepID=A0AAN8XVE2_HALRR
MEMRVSACGINMADGLHHLNTETISRNLSVMKCAYVLILLLGGEIASGYDPTWESLDKRPLPVWYDDAKIGIFIVWGVYSVPSFGSEWFWEFWQGSHEKDYVDFMAKNYPPGFTYPNFASQFSAEFYNPEDWVSVFNASGARYIVLTTKHHDGYTLWPSEFSWNWNSMDVGPKRDLVGDLAKSLRAKAPHIHLGLYHSLYEWFNPLYIKDKMNNYTTDDFVTRKTLPELFELVNDYNPDVIWSDGDWETDDVYWNATGFLAWLFSDSSVKDTVVVNDRWGKDTRCKHGSYYTCKDRYNPGVLQPHKWENCMTLDRKSWGYRRNAPVTDYLSISELLTEVVTTVSCGGNILINIGPAHDGILPAIMEERLRQLGSWLDINGEAIYKSKPWAHQNDTTTSGVWFTSKNSTVYAMILNWPKGGILNLGSVSATPQTKVKMLGYNEEDPSNSLEILPVSPTGMQITFPDMSDVRSLWAWVLVMSGVTPT